MKSLCTIIEENKMKTSRKHDILNSVSLLRSQTCFVCVRFSTDLILNCEGIRKQFRAFCFQDVVPEP